MVFRALIIAALSWTAIGTPSACRADAPRPPEVTTHDIGLCAKETDRPVCLLRTLGKRPYHFSYASRDEFRTRPDLLRLIEDPSKTVEAQTANGPRDPLEALGVVPWLQQRKAVDAVIAADRAGQSPDAAMAPIRSLAVGLPGASLLLGQIKTESGAELRADAYRSVWRRYADHKGSTEGRPSMALARAALAAWEARFADLGDEAKAGELVEAYASLGDEVGARRAAELAKQPAAVMNVRVLIALKRFDEAVAAAEALTARTAPGEYGLDSVDSTRRQLLLAVLKAERPDLVRRLSLARLGDALSRGQGISYYDTDEEQESPLAVLSRLDGPQSLAAWAERFEVAGRGARGGKAVVLSGLAVEAWVRAGRPERASAIAATWSARLSCGAYARAKRECREGREAGTAHIVETMLLWVGQYDEAWNIGYTAPADLVKFDIKRRRGLRNLDTHLARRHDQPLQIELSLATCVTESAKLALWADAESCLARLASRADRPLDAVEQDVVQRNRANGLSAQYDMPHPRQTAFNAAWEAAGISVQRSDVPAATRFASKAMQIGAGGAARELHLTATLAIEAFAIGELKSQGRL